LSRFEVPDLPLEPDAEARIAELLATLWKGLLESHYTGAEMLAFAEALVATVHDAEALAELAHHACMFHGSWHSAAKVEVLGAERLARAALALDPENDSALWLYSLDEFRSRYNSARPKGMPKLRGAPVPRRGTSEWVRRIEDTMARFDRDEHPLDLFMKMEVVPVDDVEIVTALIHGMTHTKEWRGQKACAQALGRATVDVDRATSALAAVLRPPLAYDEWNEGGEAVYAEQAVSSRAAESLKELGKKAVAALPALLDAIDAAPAFDVWDNRYHAEALLALTPHAAGATRARAYETLEALAARTRALPKEKLAFYGYTDFLAAAKTLGRAA
jgi:hypothetical protein